MAALFGNHAVIPALVEEGHEEVGRGRRKKRAFSGAGLASFYHRTGYNSILFGSLYLLAALGWRPPL